MSVNEPGVSFSFFLIQRALLSDGYEKEVSGLEEMECRSGGIIIFKPKRTRIVLNP